MPLQMYSDPSRADDPHALPDVEVFQVSPMEATYNRANADHADEYTIDAPGWWWWSCFPGCLPDGPASGPFPTQAEAEADALGLEPTPPPRS